MIEAAGKVASKEIRNICTIGGNLCQDKRCWYFNRPHCSGTIGSQTTCYKAGGKKCYVTEQEGICYSIYRGDLAPVLLVLSAKIHIKSADTERIIPLEILLSNNGKKSLNKKGEVIVSINHIFCLLLWQGFDRKGR